LKPGKSPPRFGKKSPIVSQFTLARRGARYRCRLGFWGDRLRSLPTLRRPQVSAGRAGSSGVKSAVFTPADDFRSHANSWCFRNCGGATSISASCDDCCLTRVVARSGPREADTIGIRPVLGPAWKWQRIRNMCHDRRGPQIGDVRRQHECARTAHYADRKGDEQFPAQSHLYPHTRQSDATLM
jgi:hypothetical protein